MKRRRVEQAERRKASAELNLVGDAKTRSAAASKGCLSIFGHVLIDGLILALAALGLS